MTICFVGDVEDAEALEVEGLSLPTTADMDEAADVVGMGVDDEAPSSICWCWLGVGLACVPFDIFDGFDRSHSCDLFLKSSMARRAASLRDMVG